MGTSTTCLLGRLLANGKFWLKRARIDAAHLAADSPAETPSAGPDGFLLADLRIEQGRIRAILPAGESPCCAPGLCLDGGSVRPLEADGRIGPGLPADLMLVTAEGERLIMQGGQMVSEPNRLYTA
ncbi:hypothetical protein [Azospirillum rugosum]|uniref:Amidohydrolase family protein n=1 Tax=Azospirillum rugosum TaxID=416170 RepID=A0ABS4SPH7_9PROT|nr:hypothetical protein [Azospirillum rugosum]MBP2294468.1 hypothetical protein [Azospirillum rugosum]MDQ0528973.1 hypothetical protein [Azospirillum rugosum]